MKVYQNVTRLCSARKLLTAFIQLLQLQVIQGTRNRFFLRSEQPDLNKCTWVGRHGECLSHVMQGPKLASCSSFCPGFPPYTYCSSLFHPSFQIFSTISSETFWCASNRVMREQSKVTNTHLKVLQCVGQFGFTTFRHSKGHVPWKRKISKEDITSFFWTGRLARLQTEETMSLVSVEIYWGFPLVWEYFRHWTNTPSEPSSPGNAYSKPETSHSKLQAWHCPKVSAVLPLLGATQLPPKLSHIYPARASHRIRKATPWCLALR